MIAVAMRQTVLANGLDMFCHKCNRPRPKLWFLRPEDVTVDARQLTNRRPHSAAYNEVLGKIGLDVADQALASWLSFDASVPAGRC